MKNVLDTAVDEGQAKGRYEKLLEVAREGLLNGLEISLIARLTGLSEAEIEALRQ